MKTDKITLKEIAFRVGVSPSLVSCILNGKRRASGDIQAKVTAMLEQAGYRPKHTRKPFLFISDFPGTFTHEEHIPQEQAGIQSLLTEEGCTLLVEFLPSRSSPSFSESGVETLVRQIVMRKPGGVFLSSGSPWLPVVTTVLREARIPLVQVGFDVERPSGNTVVVDSFSGAYEAVRYLIDQGHSRIATIRWTARGIPNSNRKHAGYLAALADAHIPSPPEYVRSIDTYPYNDNWVLSRRVLEDMLALPEPPTAVFVENSAISASLLYPIPGDAGQIPQAIRGVTQVHFEDLPLDDHEELICRELGYPARDTYLIVIDWHAIGLMAARIMIDSINGQLSAEHRKVRLSPILQRVQGRNRTEIKTEHANP